MTTVFDKHCAVQAKNIKTCRQLSDAMKEEFEKHMTLLPDDAPVELVREHAEHDFFFKEENQFLGVSRKIEKNEVVGRLHAWSAMEAATKDLVPRDLFRRYKNRYLGGESEVIEELANSLDGVAMKPIIWGFVFSPATSPIRMRDINLLPCRLGLMDLDPDIYLRLELKIPSSGVDTRQPTGFDAGLNEYWEPGGSTKPRDNCKTASGFPEVVIAGRSTSHPNGLTYGQMSALEIKR